KRRARLNCMAHLLSKIPYEDLTPPPIELPSRRARTRHLRRDPRSTLFVFDGRRSWLTLEAVVTILDGPDAAEQNVRLFQVMQGRSGSEPLAWFGGELSPSEFQTAMEAEGRLIYEFEVVRAYGLLAT
ncbi:MAG TPA: hypothetical protein VK951_04930, partial [Miltoncostaeaceae bacterium]|nr:hypothetical protein [Miltoncostaeaceae bacterium]